MDNSEIKILVVDDQPINLRFLSNLLTDRGYQVYRAISGQLALNAAIVYCPDLILLDIRMPEIDGYEVCKRLKATAKTEHIPVIFLSVLDEINDKLQAFRVGGSDYITKPFQVEEILARIDKQVSLKKLQQQLKEQNFQLQHSQSLLASVLNSSLDGVIAFSAVRDSQGNIVDFKWLLLNPSAEKMSHQTLKDLVGKSLLEETPQLRNNGLFELYVSVVETGKTVDREFYYEDDQNTGTWLHIVAVKLNDGLAVTFRNITDRKQAEIILTRYAEELSRSNAELEQFAYVASHDLQAPLGTITGYAQLLERRCQNLFDAQEHKFVSNIIDSCERMQALIDDLLEYSRVGRSQKPFLLTDCNLVFEDACANLQLAIRKKEAIVTSSNLPKVMADSSQLVQLLQNLIDNAIKYCGINQPIVRVEVSLQGDNWLFSVNDNGIGIAEQYQQRIFKIFQRLHTQKQYSGTGIGLAICQKIVDRHGGQIWLESEPDRGSTFYFSLPVVSEGSSH
jgi:signal transduction histidine kinase/DNA-binding response OmpR family regulator